MSQKLQQEASQKITAVIENQDHPPGRKTFDLLAELEETARKVATEQEENELDQLPQPSIVESNFDRIEKFTERFDKIVQVLAEHNLWNPVQGETNQ